MAWKQKNYSGVGDGGTSKRQGQAGKMAHCPWLDSHLGEGSNRNCFTPHLAFLWASPKSLI